VPNYPSAAAADPAQKREKRAVETTARHFAAGEPELRGSLARQPFARVLQRVYAARMSGALLLARNKVKKIVNFDKGYPVSVRSNMLSECLGQILLEQRLISAETLAGSLREMKETRKHQGEVLVAMGALSPYNLSRALMLQMESKLLEIFSWSSRPISCSSGGCPTRRTLATGTHTCGLDPGGHSAPLRCGAHPPRVGTPLQGST